MDSIKMPKAGLIKNDSSLDEQLDKDLSKLGKKIEVVESAGSGKRKMRESVINDGQEQAQKIKDKQKQGDLISNREAGLLREQDLEKENKNQSDKAEKSEQVEKDEQKKEKKSEELKEKTEKIFQQFLEKEAEFQKIKEERGLFQKTQALFGIGKNKEGHINKEFEDQKKDIEELKNEYRNKYNEFAKELVEEKKQELRNEKQSEAGVEDLIGKWVLSGKAISVKEKQEDGIEEEKKISLFEHINKKEKEILEKRREVLSEKKKGVLKKALEKYNSLSKTEKMVYGVGISSAVGATTVLAGGAAVSVALGYGAWRGGKTLLRRAAVGAVSGAAIKGMNTGLSKRDENKNKLDLEKTRENFVGGLEKEEFNLFDVLDEHNKKLKKREIKRKVIVGGTAAALFGTAIGVEALMAGDIPDEIPSNKSSADVDKIDLDKIPEDTGEDQIPDKIKGDRTNFEVKEGAELKEIEKQFSEDELKEERTIRDEQIQKSEALRGNYSAEDFEAELKLNSHFELAKDGNVWNSLSKHFDGDRQEVGKVLAEFRAETVEDLMKNHGMSDVQASQFIEWRYRHMNVGMEFELRDGKLEIPGFDDERKIARFEEQNLSKGGGADTSVFDDRKSVPPTSREAIDIPEPVETEEVLDPKISAQVDQNINNLVEYIYGGQAYEWDVMKNKNAWDIINGEYGNPITEGADGEGVEINEFIESERGAIAGNGLDQAEINNRRELQGVLIKLMEQNGIQPEPNELVEEFIRRVEVTHYTQDVGESVPENTTVEVPDPTETVEIMGPDTSEQIREIYGPQMNGYEEIKSESAQEFINDEYDASNLSRVEISRNKELKEFLLDRIKETGKNPEAGGNFSKPETIEEYLIRTSKS